MHRATCADPNGRDGGVRMRFRRCYDASERNPADPSRHGTRHLLPGRSTPKAREVRPPWSAAGSAPRPGRPTGRRTAIGRRGRRSGRCVGPPDSPTAEPDDVGWSPPHRLWPPCHPQRRPNRRRRRGREGRAARRAETEAHHENRCEVRWAYLHAIGQPVSFLRGLAFPATSVRMGCPTSPGRWDTSAMLGQSPFAVRLLATTADPSRDSGAT